jgi:hypothetical protein
MRIFDHIVLMIDTVEYDVGDERLTMLCLSESNDAQMRIFYWMM